MKDFGIVRHNSDCSSRLLKMVNDIRIPSISFRGKLENKKIFCFSECQCSQILIVKLYTDNQRLPVSNEMKSATMSIVDFTYKLNSKYPYSLRPKWSYPQNPLEC